MASPARAAAELEGLGRRLKGTAGAPLRRELLRGIRTTVKPTVEDIRQEAQDTLPSGGGLASRIASEKYAVRTRLTGASAGVRITSSSRRSLRQINAGRLRHPVYGNRKVWATQSVTPGFFDRPIEAAVPRLRRDLDDVMKSIARRIER